MAARNLLFESPRQEQMATKGVMNDDEETVVTAIEPEEFDVTGVDLFGTPEGTETKGSVKRLMSAKAKASLSVGSSSTTRVEGLAEADASLSLGAAAASSAEVGVTAGVREPDAGTKKPTGVNGDVGWKEKYEQMVQESLAMRDQMSGMMAMMQQQIVITQNQRLVEDRARAAEERNRDLDRELERDRLRLLTEAVSKPRATEEGVLEKTEVVRTAKVDAMKLAGPEEPKAAVRAGNWLARLEVTMSELSDSASVWWKEVVGTATTAYKAYQKASPLERLEIKPEIRDEGPRWVRLRARSTEILLDAIPESISAELVSTRKLHPSQIIYRIMQLYSPGGPTERAQLLSGLVHLDEFTSATVGLKVLREWQQDIERARALEVVLPDPSLLLQALEWASEQFVDLDKSRSFRVLS